MPRHFSAFYQSVDLNAALAAINAVADTQNVTNGKNVQVPAGISNVGSVYGIYGGSTFTQVQLQSPTLSALAPHDVSPILAGDVNTATVFAENLYASPIPLTATEYLNMYANGDDSEAEPFYGFVDFVDGPKKPTNGKIFTVRGTGAAALSAGVWVNTAITLGTVLPAGNYDLVGFRAESTNALGARLAFLGQGNRPGCVTRPNALSLEDQDYRYGGLGVWGSFTNQTLPSVDVIGITDTAQVFYLDLIKKG